LSPETWIFVFTLISFLVVVLVLGKFGWPAIIKTLEEREGFIKQALKDAENSRQTAEDLKKEYENRMTEVEKKVNEVLSQAQSQGTETRNSILKQAQADADKVAAKTREQLEADKEKVLKELRKEVGELSIGLAEKLMRQTVDKKVQDRALQEFLSELDHPSGKLH